MCVIVPNAAVERLKYHQALWRARTMAAQETEFSGWSENEQQDWIYDAAAQLLHDMPSTFWDDG